MQQIRFLVQPAREACQGAVATYDAMARNEDAEAVGPHGLRHGPHTLLTTYALSDMLVAARFAIGYRTQGTPHPLLKVCAHGVQRNAECRATAGEIVIELPFRQFQHGGGGYVEIGMHLLADAAQVVLGTRAIVPITKA